MAGGWIGLYVVPYLDDIMEYEAEEDTITSDSEGNMIHARAEHAISVVEIAEQSKWCN